MSVPLWLSRLFSVFLGSTLVASACGRTREVGAPCAGEDRRTGERCADPAHLLTCRDFAWHEDACRGPRGCSDGTCDQRVAEPDDGCGNRGALACTRDGKELLRCDGGVMVVAKVCRGDRGCYRDGDSDDPTCDVGDPEVGDACEASGFRCGPDGKSVLGCSPSTHEYTLRSHCLGEKGCFHFSPSVAAEQRRKKDCFAGYFACDPSVGDEGEPCGGAPEWGRPCLSGDHCPAGTTRTETSYSRDGWSFCSKDGKEELGCKDGRLVAVRSCSRCRVHWGADEEHYTVDCLDDRWAFPSGHLSGSGRTHEHERSGGGVVEVFKPEES